ncbi:MAG: hypothetical protein ACI3U1_00035 [Peptococcaceae bacterium]
MGSSKHFLTGFLCGAVLAGCTGAYAAGILAEPSAQKVYVNGNQAAINGYLINGSNYFRLRDLGDEMGFAVDYDSATDSVRIRAGEGTEETKTTAKAKTKLADVSVRYGADGRPLFYQVQPEQQIYGTGNVSKAENPYAADEYDGVMEIRACLPGTPFPSEPLGAINPMWDESYYAIRMPDPVPCYTHILPGAKSTFLDLEVAGEAESREMYVFNAHETQRIIDELYNTFLAHPECYTDGKLNCTVRVGLTASGFDGNFFYPYQAHCVEQTVGGRNVEYMVYALDTYVDGVFMGTKYCCIQNCAPGNPDIISSDSAIMKDRQTR